MTQDKHNHGKESEMNIDLRDFDLVINERDISKYVGSWGTCEEERRSWILHTGLLRNDETSTILRPLVDKKVPVRFRRRGRVKNTELVKGPWRSGRAEVNWRVTESGDEELLLFGMGSLNRSDPTTKPANPPLNVTITKETTVGGRVVQREQEEGTIAFVEENEEQKAAWEARRQSEEDATVRAIASPDFVLFLAESARSAYHLLYDAGQSRRDGGWTYASLIFLPLAIEYEMKYLLHRRAGEFRKEYKTHRLLKLFDYLPFDLQKAIDNEFRNELEKIGRMRTFQNLRVF